MDNAGAYGSSGATGDFQIMTFIRKPQVILRLVGWLFSIVVFGCISANGWYNVDKPSGNGTTSPVLVCAFGEDTGACGYGTAVGVFAFLGLMVFLLSDAMFDNVSNIIHRKYIVMADIGFSGLWTFLWFVCFCYLTNKWTSMAIKKNVSGNQAAIAFSFFSMIVFGALTALAVKRYRQGVTSDFSSGYDPDIFGEGGDSRTSAPYSGASDAYQGASDYRQSPFADPQATGKPPAPATAASGGYQGQSY